MHKVIQNRLDAELSIAGFDNAGNAVSPAQADHAVAAVKQADGDNAHRAKEALGKGHGKVADVAAGGIKHGKRLALPPLGEIHNRANDHHQHAEAEAHQGEQQHGGLHLPPGKVCHDRRRQGDLDHNFAEHMEVALLKESDPAQRPAQQNDADKTPGMRKNFYHGFPFFVLKLLFVYIILCTCRQVILRPNRIFFLRQPSCIYGSKRLFYKYHKPYHFLRAGFSGTQHTERTCILIWLVQQFWLAEKLLMMALP